MRREGKRHEIGKDDALASVRVGGGEKHRDAAVVGEDAVPDGIVGGVTHHKNVFVGGVNGDDFSIELSIKNSEETNKKRGVNRGLGDWFRNQRGRDGREEKERKNENEHEQRDEKTAERNLLDGVALSLFAFQLVECLKESL